MDPIISKIIESDPNTYVIFFMYGCFYSERALKLLRESGVAYKGYDISTIKGGMKELLDVLNKNATLINFDVKHRTRPIIFLNGKFIGGSNELAKILTINNDTIN